MIRGYELTTRAFELVTRRFELVTRGFELVTCSFEFQLVLLNFQLVTRVLPYQYQEPLLILKKCKILLHTFSACNSLLVRYKIYSSDPRECLCSS